MKLSELKKKMKGVIIVNTTPFNRDGSLDLEATHESALAVEKDRR